jgi:ceramide glucosyltransferase
MPEIVLAAAVLAGLGLGLFMTAAQRRLLRRPPRRISAGAPGVSILKPLRGSDPCLENNLESYFRVDYPSFEILLGAEDPGDPALETARRVAARHPGVPSRVVAGGPAVGRNPKVNNLARLLPHARHPVIWIADSNTEAPAAILHDLAARLGDPGVGVVSSPVDARPPGGLGAALEALQLHAFVRGGVAALSAIPGGVCVVGKSMALRRSDLERMGGFRRLGEFLAEDQVCGLEAKRLGLRCAVGAVPVVQPLGRLRLRDAASRHLRWARLRRAIAPAGFAGELLLSPVALAAAGAIALRTPSSLAVLAAATAGRIALDLAADGAVRGTRSALRVACLAPLRDLGAALLWPAALLPATVEWRGRHYRLGPRSRILPEAEPLPRAPRRPAAARAPATVTAAGAAPRPPAGCAR